MYKLLWSGLLLFLGLIASSAQAVLINAQLTGDGRAGNPDLLQVDVLIDVTGNVAEWDITVDTTNHPDIKLDEFYFNLRDPFNGNSSPWTFETNPPAGSNSGNANFYFTDFDPADWLIDSPADPVGGGTFTPNFLFEYSGSNVNNLTSLSFTMVSNIGDFVADDFLMAPSSVSTDNDLGSGQLGAHLQSLAVNDATCPDGSCSDSGFALGVYSDGGGPQQIPEPSVLALFGTGLLGLGLIGRRRKRLA
ncbi:protein of unknown function DUF1555 [Nitrosococcus halophilus Nc 4]|uniref:Ice-binding protein C-terminal domain-containing protein n=1 Tax=Nitrosococcus halophilus (strain Nc4) TaxID=472759 RepID=D5C5A1_NITHN|nr:PEP-CTERM sorting domain-containing protein [Nitrosococcus halophilus]ADE15324.1 protein of unknown function DUF1555 [Nitrosococcus halophilus Nc 4]